MSALGVAAMRRRALLCPECHRQLLFTNVKQGSCPYCNTKICIPKGFSRPAGLIGAIAVIVFLIETYRTMLAPPPDTFTNFAVFMLWFVIMFVVFLATTFLSSYVLILLFPPVVERAYANDTFTSLRLDE
jgi:hypothetical protein